MWSLLLPLIAALMASFQGTAAAKDCHRYIKIKPSSNPKVYEIDDSFRVQDLKTPYQIGNDLHFCQLMFKDVDNASEPFNQFRVVMSGLPLMPDPGCESSSMVIYADPDSDLGSKCFRALDVLMKELRREGLKVTYEQMGPATAITYLISASYHANQRCGFTKFHSTRVLKANSDEKYLVSPFYPSKVVPHLDCGWQIESEDGNPVEIVISGEFSNYCKDCGVIVSDISAILQTQRIYGNRIYEVTSANKPLDQVTLRSASAWGLELVLRTGLTLFEPKGIRVKYYTKKFRPQHWIMESCPREPVSMMADGNVRTLTLSMKESSDVPTKCAWNFVSADGHPIEIQVLSMDFGQPDDSCTNSSLAFNSGNSTYDLCGQLAASTYSKVVRSAAGAEMKVALTDTMISKVKVSSFDLRYYTKQTPSSNLAEWEEKTVSEPGSGLVEEAKNETSPRSGCTPLAVTTAWNTMALCAATTLLMGYNAMC